MLRMKKRMTRSSLQPKPSKSKKDKTSIRMAKHRISPLLVVMHRCLSQKLHKLNLVWWSSNLHKMFLSPGISISLHFQIKRTSTR